MAVFLADLRDRLLDHRVVQVIQQTVGNSISTYRTEYTTRDITIQEKKRLIRLMRMLPEQKSAIETGTKFSGFHNLLSLHILWDGYFCRIGR